MRVRAGLPGPRQRSQQRTDNGLRGARLADTFRVRRASGSRLRFGYLHTRKVRAVAAVSPLTDAQTLDLSLSRRERTSLSLILQLAFLSAGLDGAAEIFANYVRQTEADVQTRSAEAPVSAFNAGSVFGYEIGPLLKSFTPKTTFKKAKPVYELQRQTFPVLLILGFEADDFDPRIVCLGNKARANGMPCTGTPAVRAPRLLLVQSPRCTTRQRLVPLRPSRYIAWNC